jgi:hypothetical protein
MVPSLTQTMLILLATLLYPTLNSSCPDSVLLGTPYSSRQSFQTAWPWILPHMCVMP